MNLKFIVTFDRAFSLMEILIFTSHLIGDDQSTIIIIVLKFDEKKNYFYSYERRYNVNRVKTVS